MGRPTEEQLASALSEAVRTSAVGVVANGALAMLKITAGVVGDSYALVADGLESTFDIFSGLLVWGGLRISGTPPDDAFPYGRGKAEQLAALTVSTMLLAGAVGIAFGAVHGIVAPHHAPAPFTLVVLLAVVAVKEALYRFSGRRGEALGSRALESDAWHHRSDALTSVAAFVGISIALFGGEGYESADDWAALVACLVIVWNAGHLFRAASRDILDAAAPDAVHERIRELASGVSGVTGIDDVRVRKSGLVYWVDIHVEVDGAMSVHESHDIAHRVKDRLTHSELPVLDALVHIEPGSGLPLHDDDPPR